ncbi:MAG TPA: NUDIX hydrolase [Candidatus Dormibacteraeota bacterium]|nr:NUDIX hydrolase [Candidatus Dormibacteraeota bacterium]
MSQTGDEEAAGGDPAASDVPAERVVASRVLHRGRYLTFRIDTIERPDGSRAERDICGHPGAVAVVALDGDDRVLLVRQFRIATGSELLEIPAGTLEVAPDGSVEDPDAAARRELEEETGQRASTWQKLGTFWTAPGFATEAMHLYLASGLEHVRDTLGEDDDERLELVRLPWREAVELAAAGGVHDAKSLVGLFWLARLRDGTG